MQHPLIVDVKRYSVEDGPGIRSVVYFKGCPLRCRSCQKVEAQDPAAEIVFNASRCLECGKCASVCTRKAIDLRLPTRIIRHRCNRCDECVRACSGSALTLVGKYYPVPTLVDYLLLDAAFYLHSGGGVTISGGEPAMWPDYVQSLLRALKARNIHTVLRTTGCFDYGVFEEKILPFVDLIYLDLRIADPEAHKEHTGQSNERIIENFRRLCRQAGERVQPRIPLIPGVTASKENFVKLVDLLYGAGADGINLISNKPLAQKATARAEYLAPPEMPPACKEPDEDNEAFAIFQSVMVDRQLSMKTGV